MKVDFFKILVLSLLGIIVLILLRDGSDSQPAADVVSVAGETFFASPLLIGIVCLMLLFINVSLIAYLVKSKK